MKNSFSRNANGEDRKSFGPGTLVRKKSTRDSLGTILNREPEILAGEKYYSVLFQSSSQIPEKACESDLELFQGEVDIKVGRMQGLGSGGMWFVNLSTGEPLNSTSRRKGSSAT